MKSHARLRVGHGCLGEMVAIFEQPFRLYLGLVIVGIRTKSTCQSERILVPLEGLLGAPLVPGTDSLVARL